MNSQLLRFSIVVTLSAVTFAAAPLRFRSQEIQSNFGVVYAVSTADMNKDGKMDIVAINPTQVVWFENPTWTKHVIMDGVTKKDNVVSMTVGSRCGCSTRSFLATFENDGWHLGPPRASAGAGGWSGGIGSGCVGRPAGCPCFGR